MVVVEPATQGRRASWLGLATGRPGGRAAVARPATLTTPDLVMGLKAEDGRSGDEGLAV